MKPPDHRGAHLPLSVLLTPQGIVTLSQGTTSFLQPLLDGHVQGLSTDRGTEFVLRVFWQLADACLRGTARDQCGRRRTWKTN